MTARMDDGGPAFPFNGKAPVAYFEGEGLQLADVSAPGATLRDWFAWQAMAAYGPGWFRWSQRITAKMAYEQADAMLAARKGGAA